MPIEIVVLQLEKTLFLLLSQTSLSAFRLEVISYFLPRFYVSLNIVNERTPKGVKKSRSVGAGMQRYEHFLDLQIILKKMQVFFVFLQAKKRLIWEVNGLCSRS